ncbi:receptor-like protein kinase [Musa troglodytarum]|uniref:Receptor-like protein kinase n=1 Tax=Musa troglodytarum TaxID=320322 RepID=A0A9E7GY24_9LILI|nr:receptor-like protein kinase [Musa troglodytarum]
MFPANVSSSSLFPLLGFVLLILCHSSLTGAQNLDQICDASGSFADNSTYQSNLKLYLSSLPSKGSVSGFLKETVGEVPDQVYGVSLCRGDVNASECRACLNKASLDVQQICPYNKGAMIYYDYCLLRFSNQNFLSSTDNQQVPKYNSSSVTQVVRLSQLLHLLLSSATDWAANSTKRFATGEMSNFTSEFPTIYVMVECTPDLSPSDCSQCLQSLFDPLPTDMVGRQGARVIGVRCVMRYELSSFSKVPSMLKLTAPLEDATQLRSAGKKKNAATTALAIAIPAFTALLILSLIYICYWRTRKRIIQSAYETVPELITGVESLLFDLSTLRLATANFSEENKLGEGDPERSEQLRWGTRYRIIRGIAQGLLYLHEESQLKIIHRDLKTSMNPKISDFGIAKLFDADQTQDTTKRVVGTFGYMAPEYVKHGKFSVRSDVFSFGILVLEILTGRKNSKSYNSEYSESLLSYTWEKWRCGSILEMVDPALDGHCQGSDLLRCMQIGLLCVQENPNDRPTMSTVVTMLNSGIAFLQAPGRPAFYVEQEDVNVKITANDATIAIDVCDGESKPLPASSTQICVCTRSIINSGEHSIGGKKKNAATTALAIAIPAFTALLILSLIYICYWRTRKRIIQSAYETVPELITGVESLLFDLSTLRLATANFSEENKLGEGDPERSEQLRWGTRYRIIRGIAQGLLYLHEESQLKIIHRDLKASMNPKISDFGIAKLFDADQTQDTTKRVVGTFGYMAPEYVKHGKFSVRSDVFSFGILVLEILTGRKNSKSYNSEHSESLLSYTWEKWRCGSILEMVDPALDGHYQGSDLLRCMQIGLLCVQENPNDRPTMSTVVTMLNSGIAFLQAPGRPAFYVEQEDVNVKITANDATIAIDVCDGESMPLPASSTQVSISEQAPR